MLDGNQDSKKDHENVQTSYLFDGLGRLTNETEFVPAGARGQSVAQTVSKSYTFNTAGNRATMAVATTGGTTPENYSVQYQYDGNNRLLTEIKTPVSGAAVTTTYTHDPNGNQTLKQVSGTGVTEARSYDTFNRLTGVNSGSVNATYLYRPDNMRLSKNVNGQRTTHIWDGGNITPRLHACYRQTHIGM